MARTSEVGVPAVAAARRTASPSDADGLLRDLYAEHGPALLRLTTALTGGDRSRAEDLVQETMLRAWNHRDNSDFQRRSPRAWLMTTRPAGTHRRAPGPACPAPGDRVRRRS